MHRLAERARAEIRRVLDLPEHDLLIVPHQDLVFQLLGTVALIRRQVHQIDVGIGSLLLQELAHGGLLKRMESGDRGQVVGTEIVGVDPATAELLRGILGQPAALGGVPHRLADLGARPTPERRDRLLEHELQVQLRQVAVAIELLLRGRQDAVVDQLPGEAVDRALDAPGILLCLLARDHRDRRARCGQVLEDLGLGLVQVALDQLIQLFGDVAELIEFTLEHPALTDELLAKRHPTERLPILLEERGEEPIPDLGVGQAGVQLDHARCLAGKRVGRLHRGPLGGFCGSRGARRSWLAQRPARPRLLDHGARLPRDPIGHILLRGASSGPEIFMIAFSAGCRLRDSTLAAASCCRT